MSFFYYFFFLYFICISSFSHSCSCFACPGDVNAVCVWRTQAAALYLHRHGKPRRGSWGLIYTYTCKVMTKTFYVFYLRIVMFFFFFLFCRPRRIKGALYSGAWERLYICIILGRRRNCGLMYTCTCGMLRFCSGLGSPGQG